MQEFRVAYSCKPGGGCAALTMQRMVETPAELVEHDCPAMAVRQWVVVLSKRLCYL